MDIDAYLKRIGYSGSLQPSLTTLSGIVFAHATSIPFENLAVLAGEVISLETSDIERKLVAERRGGYCFEQNALLGEALTILGFDVRQHSARVWYNPIPGTIPPRTHVFLSIALDGIRWIADCGIGGSTPTGPMQMDLIDDVQQLDYERRRIVQLEGRLVPTYMQQLDFGTEWVDVYEFTGEEMPKIDQEMGNWWTSAHPDSKFRKNLVVAMLGKDGSRMNLWNRNYVHRRGAEIFERRELGSLAELSSLLETRFGLDLPSSSSLQFLF